MKMRTCLLAFLGLIVIGLSCVPVARAETTGESPATESPAESKKPAAYADRGALTCIKCHDQSPVADILKTPHVVKGDGRTPFGQDNHDCETCHGASPEHIHSHPASGEKRESTAVVFKGPNAASVEKRNEMCTNCHENGMRMNWRGSQHQSNDVACVDCHTVHVTKDPVLVKQKQPEKCFTCHAEQRAQSFMYSHHPVREGKVSCGDCHSVHGSPGPKLMKEFTVNQTCYNCHAEKRGPFMWEHQPVREDCISCHTPHGSTEARLMSERMNFMCSACHSGSTSANSGAAFGGHGALSGSQKNIAISSGLANQRTCLNCHSQVHGSNSANGAYFLR